MEAVSEDQGLPSYRTHESTETLPMYEDKLEPHSGHPDKEKEKNNTKEAIETLVKPYLDVSEVESIVGLDDETILEAELQRETVRKQGSQWFLVLKIAFIVPLVGSIVIFSVTDDTYRLPKDEDGPKSYGILFYIGYFLPMGLFAIINVIENNIRR